MEIWPAAIAYSQYGFYMALAVVQDTIHMNGETQSTL